MAADVTVRMDRAAIRALEAAPFTRDEIDRAGDEFAAFAAAMAPKRSGAGAASIGPRPAADTPGAVDVSWDSDHFYMVFQEDGTKYVPARRFLRGAFEHYIHT